MPIKINARIVWFLMFLRGLYSSLTKTQSNCELEALNIGTRLADRYNWLDENTDWDTRLHSDYITKYMGFSGWVQGGLWKGTGLTALRNNAKALYQSGGWTGVSGGNVKDSAYWAFEDKWVYFMGDSTMRQIWATIASPLSSGEFEKNAKEWSRENCAKQFPKRKKHPADGYFPDEGWGGRCGNNELTCHVTGFGSKGKLSFDWKHFTWEDYDQWIFGETGLWQRETKEQTYPDILVIHVGLHTCVHSWSPQHTNQTMVDAHERDLPVLMNAVKLAINRPPPNLPRTLVIFQLPGRAGGSDARQDHCSRHYNRMLARAAHEEGFVVLEREEIERRLLFKSEFYKDHRSMKPSLHLESPGPNIVATSLLGLVSCLNLNESDPRQVKYRNPDTI